MFAFSNTPTIKLQVEVVFFRGSKGGKVEGVHLSAEEENSTDNLKWKMEGKKGVKLATPLVADYFIKSLQFLSFNQSIHICKETFATFK